LNATFRANQEAIIPLFKDGENGNIIINNNKPVMINGKPSDIIPNIHTTPTSLIKGLMMMQ